MPVGVWLHNIKGSAWFWLRRPNIHPCIDGMDHYDDVLVSRSWPGLWLSCHFKLAQPESKPLGVESQTDQYECVVNSISPRQLDLTVIGTSVTTLMVFFLYCLTQLCWTTCLFKVKSIPHVLWVQVWLRKWNVLTLETLQSLLEYRAVIGQSLWSEANQIICCQIQSQTQKLISFNPQRIT